MSKTVELSWMRARGIGFKCLSGRISAEGDLITNGIVILVRHEQRCKQTSQFYGLVNLEATTEQPRRLL